jgi:hypothetical protein
MSIISENKNVVTLDLMGFNAPIELKDGQLLKTINSCFKKLQSSVGKFEISESEFFDALRRWWNEANKIRVGSFSKGFST